MPVPPDPARPTAPGGPSTGPKRRDAARNRQALIDAARELFAREGLQVPTDRIAKAAGIGNATFYRHFPDRDALVEEIFRGTAETLGEAAAEALARDEAWPALAGYFERIFALVSRDRGLNDLVTAAAGRSAFLDDISRGNAATVTTLVARAQEEGTLRTDVAAMDVLVLMGPLLRAMPALVADHPEGWRRPLALLLDAFRPTGHPLPGTPVPPERLDQTFSRLWQT
ncbi:hypothetical protein CFP65_4519 [Kitasatospora sp. MMS16-BH015]|uniref:TetR/AcrR family transcriptional regulator n=1 Tax=Kitasatospora sp. MMS16-BH015 TaxID=2018025 RepID=UPI000CA1A2F1|nr:TetR/AcrR family transcriptional regulator [Kitasatospora sp. MMS16-BH015]AUG79266.1 hypothetical protein CFP65_4519 [Kitasatospora sp. MMS16-BH015]